MKIAYGTYLTWPTVRRGLLRIGLPGVTASFPILPWWLRVLAAMIAFDGAWAHARIVRSARMFYRDTRSHEQFCRILLDQLGWNASTAPGRLLDIGTGAGLAAIGAAKRFPHAAVVGIDTWSAGFIGLTLAACVRNARAEGVIERVRFEAANAVALPYPDGSFDAVISNSVFHLVGKSGYPALGEALRVLRPGGVFAFNDPFEISALYGSVDEVIQYVADRGGCEISYAPIATLTGVPAPMIYLTVGVGILSGVKSHPSLP